MSQLVRTLNCWLFLVLAGPAIVAGQAPVGPPTIAPSRFDADPPPGDLFVSNLFSAGWDEDFVRRQRTSGTPDIALLRVPTNFQTRFFGSLFAATDNVASPSVRDIVSEEAEFGYSFNRRFEVLLYDNYQWLEMRSGPNLSGGAPGIGGRLQLIDTDSSSCCMAFRGFAPNTGIGSEQTILTTSLAGFEDLGQCLQWYRTGLYWGLIFDNYVGPAAVGTKSEDFACDVSLARTITPPDTPLFGNCTLFVENYVQSDLDGTHAGRTSLTLTPGVRFNLGKCPAVKFGIDNLILLGVDIPVSDYKPSNSVFRFTYFKDF